MSIECLIFSFTSETRKVTFTKEQMENWNVMTEERLNDIARIIETAKQ